MEELFSPCFGQWSLREELEIGAFLSLREPLYICDLNHAENYSRQKLRENRRENLREMLPKFDYSYEQIKLQTKSNLQIFPPSWPSSAKKGVYWQQQMH